MKFVLQIYSPKCLNEIERQLCHHNGLGSNYANGLKPN